MKINLKRLVLCIAVIVFLQTPAASFSNTGLPRNIAVGYWGNWFSASTMRLSQVDAGWDVVIVSFMLTDETNSRCVFTPDSALYPGGDEEFIDDIRLLQARGQKVLISFGGALGYCLELDTIEQRDEFFVTSRDIIEYYGFDGFDFNIEQRLINVDGETSVLNPTKPMNLNLIWICYALRDYFGDGFILTMAPEHPYVQGGAFYWGGWENIWGGYLPFLNGVRDVLTFVHVQLYNNSFMSYPQPYRNYGVDTFVYVTEMLINGFDVAEIDEHFPGLRPDQVVLGVLTVNGEVSENGELTAAEYGQALERLIENHPDFRGIMTWSIGHDHRTGGRFIEAVRGVIDRRGYCIDDVLEILRYLAGLESKVYDVTIDDAIVILRYLAGIT
jgi:chitinase